LLKVLIGIIAAIWFESDFVVQVVPVEGRYEQFVRFADAKTFDDIVTYAVRKILSYLELRFNSSE
jgi:hypothetical protein